MDATLQTISSRPGQRAHLVESEFVLVETGTSVLVRARRWLDRMPRTLHAKDGYLAALADLGVPSRNLNQITDLFSQ